MRKKFIKRIRRYLLKNGGHITLIDPIVIPVEYRRKVRCIIEYDSDNYLILATGKTEYSAYRNLYNHVKAAEMINKYLEAKRCITQQ